MRILSALLFSSLIFSVALAQQVKPAGSTPAKAAAAKAAPAVQEKQQAAAPSSEKTATASGKATAVAQGIDTKANSLGLTVTRAIIAGGIDENNRPVDPGTEFATDGKRVYCITQIEGAKEPVNIEHRWCKNGVLINTVELPIKSLNWRTQSYKTITPTMVGKWKVDVVLMPGEEFLTSVNFTVK